MSRHLLTHNISSKYIAAQRSTDRQTKKHGQKHIPPPLSEVMIKSNVKVDVIKTLRLNSAIMKKIQILHQHKSPYYVHSNVTANLLESMRSIRVPSLVA